MKSKQHMPWLLRLGLCLTLFAILITTTHQSALASSFMFSTGEILPGMDQQSQGRVDKFTIQIPQLGNRERNIQVYLPPGYDTSGESYPVFYILDGEFLFNPPERGIGDYAIDETLERLTQQGILDPMIVVGIEHDFDIPWSEYTPWKNENMHDWVKESNSAPVEGGEGLEFINFIVETLKPKIDASYRTLPDREFTAIGGFCRMGLIPLLAGFKYPDTFSKVMSNSPTVWLAEGGGIWLSNNRMIKYINNNPMPDNVKFYIDVGTDEASGNRPPIKDAKGNRITYPQAYLEGAQTLYQALIKNQVPEANIYFQIVEGVSGTRDEWAKRFDQAVVWLYEEEMLENTNDISEPKVEDEKLEELKPILKRTPAQMLSEVTEPKLSAIKIIGILAGGFVLLATFALFIGVKRNV